jgi:hypothetical protein
MFKLSKYVMLVTGVTLVVVISSIAYFELQSQEGGGIGNRAEKDNYVIVTGIIHTFFWDKRMSPENYPMYATMACVTIETDNRVQVHVLSGDLEELGKLEGKRVRVGGYLRDNPDHETAKFFGTCIEVVALEVLE